MKHVTQTIVTDGSHSRVCKRRYIGIFCIFTNFPRNGLAIIYNILTISLSNSVKAKLLFHVMSCNYRPLGSFTR